MIKNPKTSQYGFEDVGISCGYPGINHQHWVVKERPGEIDP